MDHNQQDAAAGTSNRGRRGPDRRGPERRHTPPQAGARPERNDRVDVEQIMREIRARIAQRSGIDLSNQQIQELAARRLEAILDPRGSSRACSISCGAALVSGRRRPMPRRRPPRSPIPSTKPPSTIRRTACCGSFAGCSIRSSGCCSIRRRSRKRSPSSARLNAELATREAERDRRQAEWNALHYEILQRLAIEVSRASIEAQSLALRVESLATKVDFNERRVRTMEGTQARTPRPQEASLPCSVRVAGPTPETARTAAARAGRPRW